MASLVHYPLPLCFFVLILHFQGTISNLHRTKLLLDSSLISQPVNLNNDTSPTRFFEVTKPIKRPKSEPCTDLLLHHDFGYTYGKPPVIANYTPPFHCSFNSFSKIVLQWNATCKGRQFDRIFGVWLGGVELLRSCSAEPRATGIVWTVEKDVTRYSSLLLKNETQSLAVYMGNLVDKTYTGVYHVDITAYFYPAGESDFRNHGDGNKADLILPISRNLPLNDGLWFEIENSTDVQVKEFIIPQNVYRAVLEVYVSFHENDEFWYGNFPDEYIDANNLTDYPGNGPFREVQVRLDGKVVGAVWPFTVIYTGGVNPLLWRPVTGIGSFDLPSYDIEVTPFLGDLLDGKSHEVGFSVTNGLNVWYIDANLHLWLDSKSPKTTGKVEKYSNVPPVVSLVSNFKGLNGMFLTEVNRSISSSGWVLSSRGNITTQFIQDFTYNNSMVIGKEGDLQTVNQTIHFNDQVSGAQTIKSLKLFSLYLYTDSLNQGNGSSLEVSNVTLGFDENISRSDGFGSSGSFLNNLQNGQGEMVVKNNLVQSGIGSTQQVSKYRGDELCYFRNISASNYTILYDEVEHSCKRSARSRFRFSLRNGGLFHLNPLF